MLFHQIHQGNALEIVKSIGMVDCVITSPPYFKKRRYGKSDNELGQEKDVNEYLNNLVDIFNSISLFDRGSIWVNIGDTRISSGLMMIPERFAMRMIESGWFLVDDVIWAKSVVNIDGSADGHCMIEPATTRLNGNGYEHLYRFIRCKPNEAWTDHCAVRIPRQGVEDIPYLPKEIMTTHTSIEGRVLSNVWRVPMGQTKKKHYAVFPPALCERPLAMTCPMRVCNVCGHVRTRVVEMEEYDEGRSGKRIFGKYSSQESVEKLQNVSGRMDAGRSYVPKKPVTKSWTSCEHEEWRSGIVLDPFCGSGSLAAIALKMGRSFIGIDLYEENVKLTKETCKNTLSEMSYNPYMMEK